VRRLDAAFDDAQELSVFFYEIAKVTKSGVEPPQSKIVGATAH
jgi:hypothetical protein